MSTDEEKDPPVPEYLEGISLKRVPDKKGTDKKGTEENDDGAKTQPPGGKDD